MRHSLLFFSGKDARWRSRTRLHDWTTSQPLSLPDLGRDVHFKVGGSKNPALRYSTDGALLQQRLRTPFEILLDMDGISLAASIAGITSLGIQVTKSLVDFYSAWKSQYASVASTIKRLESLLSMLAILRNLSINRDDEQKTPDCIIDCIQGCEECVSELRVECDKFSDFSINGLRAFARSSARRIAYPFRQSTLQKLDEEIEQFLSQLSLALQILEQRDINTVHRDIEDTKLLLDLVRANQFSSNIRDWLRAPDASINYNDACKKRHNGTGLWLVKGRSYCSWLVHSNSFLWLYGFAGCGKSVLCSTAIQHVFRHRRSNPHVGIAFFFFTFSDDAKQDTSAMLRALVLQLSGQLDSNNRNLSQLYDSYRNTTPPDQALMNCLHQLIRSFDNTYIILDALDECPRHQQRGDVMQALVELRAWSEPGLHLLVTSRDEVDIRDVLNNETRASGDEKILLKNDSVNRDIASFISGSLKNDRRLRKWEKYHDQIENALTERAYGVFRWVECQLTALVSCPRSKRQLDMLLVSLPRSLDKTYEQMLLRISKESEGDAKRLLTLLCCAKRPLTVSEVIEGIAVELEDDPWFNIDGRLNDEEDLHQICPGLIEIDPNIDDCQSTVRIAHFSVQEYLESERIRQHRVAAFGVKRPEAHAAVACICLTYLLEPKSTLHDPEYPLSLYAAKSWFEHYREGDEKLYHVHDQAIRLFRSSKKFEQWVRTWNLDEYRGKEPHGKAASPVYYASLLGFDSIVSELLCETSDVNTQQGGIWGTALQAASATGHEKIVQLLIEKGADMNIQTRLNGTALQTASRSGREKIVRLLINKGAEINRQSRRYGTALQIASFMGHEKIVQLLIEKGADINIQDRRRGTALQIASDRGHEKIAQLLINKGAVALV